MQSPHISGFVKCILMQQGVGTQWPRAGEICLMSYAGDISCREGWEMLSADPTAQLIDVRTSAEWNFVGVAMLAPIGKEPLLVEWQHYPSMAVNASFVEAVSAQLRRLDVGTDAPLLCICRSGARSASAAAALTAAGFSAAYNIAGGFEGARDANGHRGAVEGWKHDGLPWMQG